MSRADALIEGKDPASLGSQEGRGLQGMGQGCCLALSLLELRSQACQALGGCFLAPGSGVDSWAVRRMPWERACLRGRPGVPGEKQSHFLISPPEMLQDLP